MPDSTPEALARAAKSCKAASDLFKAASILRGRPDSEIRDVVSLMQTANAPLVAWTLNHLPRIVRSTNAD